MILEADQAIQERFTDIFVNSIDLDKDGKVTPSGMMRDDARLAELFTQIIEETNWRGALTEGLMKDTSKPIKAYFADGVPLGVRMFGSMDHLPGRWLVKYSKREYVEDMQRFGRFRISPASEYAKGSYIKAIKDLETSRPYKLKGLVDVLKGREIIEFQGHKIPIKNGIVDLSFDVDDYFLFSTCKEIDRRMPTDFEADAALVIKNKAEFLSRLKSAMRVQYPDWEFLEDEVYYYDPYNDIPNKPNQEFWKHFAYAYQKEHRCVLRRRFSPAPHLDLQPFFVELGSLQDISEVVVPS